MRRTGAGADPRDRAWREQIEQVVEPHRVAMRRVIGALDPEGQRAVIAFMAAAAPAVRALLDP